MPVIKITMLYSKNFVAVNTPNSNNNYNNKK